MDVQKLIGEVARRHSVLVDPSDPIFVAVTLNELLLAEQIEVHRAATQEACRATVEAMQRHAEDAKHVASQLVTGSASYVTDQIRIAGAALRAQLDQLHRDALRSVREACTEAAKQRTLAQRTTVVAVGCACLCFGIALALLARAG